MHTTRLSVATVDTKAAQWRLKESDSPTADKRARARSLTCVVAVRHCFEARGAVAHSFAAARGAALRRLTLTSTPLGLPPLR